MNLNTCVLDCVVTVSPPSAAAHGHQVIKPIVAARPNLVDTSTLASHGNLYGRPIILAARDIEIATSIFAARKSQAVTPIVAARAVRLASTLQMRNNLKVTYVRPLIIPQVIRLLNVIIQFRKIKRLHSLVKVT